MALSQLYLQQRQLYNILSEVKCIMHVKSNDFQTPLYRTPRQSFTVSLGKPHCAMIEQLKQLANNNTGENHRWIGT